MDDWWSPSHHCTAVTPALPDPSSSYLAEIWSFIFSIFLENFDHWLPRLTNERSDRVTCVAPPAPTPHRHPARVGENLHNCGEREGRPARPASVTGGPGPATLHTTTGRSGPAGSVSLPTGSPGLGVSRILWGGR